MVENDLNSEKLRKELQSIEADISHPGQPHSPDCSRTRHRVRCHSTSPPAGRARWCASWWGSTSVHGCRTCPARASPQTPCLRTCTVAGFHYPQPDTPRTGRWGSSGCAARSVCCYPRASTLHGYCLNGRRSFFISKHNK